MNYIGTAFSSTKHKRESNKLSGVFDNKSENCVDSMDLCTVGKEKLSSFVQLGHGCGT